MAEFSDDAKAFARVVAALEPYLGDLVFVGGWAHRLLAFHELAGRLDFLPLATTDTDIAAPLRMQAKGSSMRDLLRKNGFAEELSGDETPPISEYRLGAEEGALYVEFLAPQSGGPNKRDGSADATVEIAGVSAQKLKYLEVLFKLPWSVRLNDANGFPLGPEGLTIRVPNPAAYVMHKVLVLANRKPSRQGKDVLYVHDTLMMFARSFEQLRTQARLVCDALHPRWIDTFNGRRAAHFRVVDDRLRAAELIARNSGRPSPPPVESIRRVCESGLNEIFGPVPTRAR